MKDFLEKSEELLQLDDKFEEKIFEENVKLLLGKLMPLPRKLRESMLGMDPVQSYTEKYFQLRENLRCQSRFLAAHLRKISAVAIAGEWNNFSLEEGISNDNDEYDRIGYYNEGLPEIVRDDVDMDCESDSEISLNKQSERLNEDKENFAAKLRWLRWKIYQKIENKISTRDDVEKYEELVIKFVSKFKSTQLSGLEVSIWLNKVLQTKRDAHARIFGYISEASEVFSEVSSQEHSMLSDFEEIEPEVDSVTKFFDEAIDYEYLCSTLPDVPEDEDPNPDEEIEQRLRKLKEGDENDFESKTKIPLQLKVDVEDTVSRTENLEDRNIESDKREADIVDDKIATMEMDKNSVNFNSTQPNDISYIDDKVAKNEFNEWYESQLGMKERKSKIRVISEPPGHSYSSKVDDDDEDNEYKQLSSTSSDNQAQGDKKVPDLLCFLQAYFVLLISTCKSLNDVIEIFLTFSQSSFPVIPYQPVQSIPLPSCSTDVCECQTRCYCVKATAAITSAVVSLAAMTTSGSAGLSVGWKWMCFQLRNLKENVILNSIGVSEQFESIEELRQAIVFK